TRSVTDFYFFIVRVATERPANWPRNKPFGPSVFLGFLNKKPRNTNSEMKIRVSITDRPMLVLMLMAQLDNVSPQAFGLGPATFRLA
ncbi:MAG: hypothetical protein ACKVKR_06395, partial [Pseudomonadales bacterium]